MTRAEPLLALEGLSKAFAGVQAVRGVSVEIPAGAVLGVMGPNGSGKTTLFNLIAGVFRPDARSDPPPGPRRHGLAAAPGLRARGRPNLPARRGPFPGLSAIDNVLVGPLCTAVGGCRGRRAAAEAERLLTLVGLEAKGPVCQRAG